MSTNEELIAEARVQINEWHQCLNDDEQWAPIMERLADAFEAILPKEPTFSQRHEAMKAISRPFRRSPSDGLIETWESAAVNALIEAGWRPILTAPQNGATDD